MNDLPMFDPFKALAEARKARGTELPQKLPQPPAEVNREIDQRLSPTSATFAASAGGLREPQDFRTPLLRKKERFYSIFSRTCEEHDTLADHQSGHGCHTHAEVAEAAEVSLSNCDRKVSHKTPPAEVLGPLLRKWHEGVARLSPGQPPCPGLSLTDWSRTYSSALAFLDTFGAQAEALGWQTSELWGVHPERGTIRVDHCGALLLTAGHVRAITADTIAFERTTFRRKVGSYQGIPVWEFGR